MKKVLKHTVERHFRLPRLYLAIFELTACSNLFHHFSLQRQMFAGKIFPFSQGYSVNNFK